MLLLLLLPCDEEDALDADNEVEEPFLLLPLLLTAPLLLLVAAPSVREKSTGSENVKHEKFDCLNLVVVKLSG